MSDAPDPWSPVHHEEADDPTETTPASGKPRDSKLAAEPPPLPVPIPMAMALMIPPELIAALSSLAGTMERIATEVSAQGMAIQELAAAIAARDASQDKVS